MRVQPQAEVGLVFPYLLETGHDLVDHFLHPGLSGTRRKDEMRTAHVAVIDGDVRAFDGLGHLRDVFPLAFTVGLHT